MCILFFGNTGQYPDPVDRTFYKNAIAQVEAGQR
jgi:hypothetical protein